MMRAIPKALALLAALLVLAAAQTPTVQVSAPVVDVRPPVPISPQPPNSSVVANSTAPISVRLEDTGSGINLSRVDIRVVHGFGTNQSTCTVGGSPCSLSAGPENITVDVNYTTPAPLKEGQPVYICLNATDLAGNANLTSTCPPPGFANISWTFNLLALGPSFSNFVPSNGGTVGTNIPALAVDVTDPSGVNASTVLFNITHSSGSLVTVPVMTPIAGGLRASFTPLLPPGNVTVDVSAQDAQGNPATGTWTFFIDPNLVIKALSFGPPYAGSNTTLICILPACDEPTALRRFNLTLNQAAEVNWYINGTLVQNNTSQSQVAYTNLSAKAGSWNVSAFVVAPGGILQHNWTWDVVSYGVDLTVDRTVAQTEPKKNATYIATVRNTGTQNDAFQINISNLGGASTAAANRSSVTLAPNATADVALDVSDTTVGSRTVALRATSQANSAKTASISTTTEIVRVLEVNANATDRAVQIAGTPVHFTITVRNTGTQSHTFALWLNNSTATAALNLSTITLNPGAEGYRLLTVSSNSTGTFSARVVVEEAADPSQTASLFFLYTASNLPVYGASLSANDTSREVNATQDAHYLITLTNIGNVGDTFDILVSNPFAQSVTFDTTPLALAAGAAGAPRLLTVRGGTPGVYTVSVVVQSQGNPSKTDRVDTTTLVRSYRVGLTSPSLSLSAFNNTSVVFTLRVSNLGNGVDGALLQVLDKTADSATLGASGFSALSPGETRETTLTVFNASPGTARVNLSAASQNNTSAFANLTLQVDFVEAPRRGVRISVDRAIQTAEVNDTVPFLVTVRNTGNVADSVLLSLTSTASANVGTTTNPSTPVSLKAGESQTFPLGLHSISPGVFDFILKGTSQSDPSVSDVLRAGAVYRSPVTLTVDPPSQTVANDTDAVYRVTVTNPGIRSHRFLVQAVNLSGAREVSLTSPSVDLYPGESATLQLTVNASIAGAYSVRVNAVESLDALKNTSALTATMVIPVERPVYGLAVAVDSPVQVVRAGSAATYFVTLTNLGNRNDTFQFTATNVSTAAQQVTMDLSNSTLVRGSSTTRLLRVNDSRPGAYEIRLNVTSLNRSDVFDTLSVITTFIEVRTESSVVESCNVAENVQVTNFSVLRRCTVGDLSVLNASILEDSGVNRNARVDRSTINNSSTVESDPGSPTAILRSNITNSTIQRGTHINNSTVINSTVAGVQRLEDGRMVDGVVLHGNVTFNPTVVVRTPAVLKALVVGGDQEKKSLAGASGTVQNLAANASQASLNLSLTQDYVGGSLSVHRTLLPTGGAETTTGNVGGYATIEASSNIRGATGAISLKLYYTDADIPLGVDSGSLRVRLFNETTLVWENLTSTLGQDAKGKFVQTAAPHLSVFSIAGTAAGGGPPPPPPPAGPVTAGGAGGGAVGAPAKPLPVVLEKECQEVSLSAGAVALTRFTKVDVTSMNVTGASDGKVQMCVEHLATTDGQAAPDTVYQYLRVSADPASAVARIESARLRVERAWIDVFHINDRTLRVHRQAGDAWTAVQSSLDGVEDEYLYLRIGPESPGVWAITAEKRGPLGLPRLTASVAESERHLISLLQAGVDAVLKFARTDVTEIVFKVRNTIPNILLEVQKLMGRPPEIPAPQRMVYNYFTVRTINIEEKDLVGATIQFHVPRQWMRVNGAAPDTIKLARFNGERWVELPTQRIGIEGDAEVFKGRTPGFSIFALAGDPEPARISMFAILSTRPGAIGGPEVRETVAETGPSATLPLLLLAGAAGAGVAVFVLVMRARGPRKPGSGPGS